MRHARLALALVAALGIARSASAQGKDDVAIVLRGKIVTMDAQGRVLSGAVVVRKGKVEKILGPSDPAPAGAIVIDTKGFIYPGLMNLHDHIAYNFLPLYPVPKSYTNRDQWPSGKLYEALVNNPKNLVTGHDGFDLQTEALKYAEVKAIAGGETAIQGSPSDSGSGTILVRNVELPNFGEDKVGERALSIDQMFVKDLDHQRQSVAKLSSWFFHLSEGIDDHARDEYSNPSYDPKKNVGPHNQGGLVQLGMVMRPLIGIHCTALGDTEFADWKNKTGDGAKIVWSPLSNLMLYGKTTDILAARRHGATIALGTDWSPSGSKNLLWELKVADEVNRQLLGNGLTSRDLVSMVTTNAAKLLAWEDKVGSIAPGMVADLVVVDDVKASDPYRNLIEAVERNVQLVVIGGDPIYGDETLLARLKTKNGTKLYESVGTVKGRAKAIDLKRPVTKGQESLADIESALVGAVKFDAGALAQRLNASVSKVGKGEDPHKSRTKIKRWLAEKLKRLGKPVPADLASPSAPITTDEVKQYLALKFPNARPLAGIDPIFEQTDDAYFGALEKNLHFVGAKRAFDVTPLEKYR